jgi:hypothetical protein
VEVRSDVGGRDRAALLGEETRAAIVKLLHAGKVYARSEGVDVPKELSKPAFAPQS